ncbi:MAG: LysM domain-containing protein [Anaerolineae bacterium]
MSAAPTRAAPGPAESPAPASSPTAAQYTVQSGDTWVGIADRFDLDPESLQNANPEVATLTPGQILSIPAPTPLPLLVYPPTCYQNRPNNLLCLGRIDNPLDFPVESVAIEVRLIEEDGSVFLSERSTIEQASIPSGSFAPYQATFEANAGDFSSADASLISVTRSAEDRFVVLVIEDVKGETLGGRVIVSATVYNPGPQNAEIVRVFVTMLDGSERVAGYRVVTFDGGITLDAGARLPLSIDLASQALEVTPDYSLYVEAHPVEQ